MSIWVALSIYLVGFVLGIILIVIAYHIIKDEESKRK